jgi:acyl-coenzyme A thioesterase PaaI-like protein
MQYEPQTGEFDIQEARRVLGNVFAPWVPMTTVDQTTHFMRAVTSADVLADARVVRLGRTMSFGRVTLSSATDNKPVAMVSSAFAML